MSIVLHTLLLSTTIILHQYIINLTKYRAIISFKKRLIKSQDYCQDSFEINFFNCNVKELIEIASKQLKKANKNCIKIFVLKYKNSKIRNIL